MAKRKSDRQAPEAEEEDPSATDELPVKERDELALAAKEEGGEGEEDEESAAPDAVGAEGDELAVSDDSAPAQLGTERYVLAGFFASGMLLAYVLGKFVHGVWAYASNKDWFSQNLPRLAAVSDDEKATYGFILGSIAAVILVLRTYRRPDVRSWSEEVAAELTKVKWPTKKDVTNSTMIVIAASALATVYLALLDRLWGFITNLVYGDGS